MAQKQKLVSPAFGNHILFPSDSPVKKHTKDRMPLAVTSSAFREYFKIKEQEKERKAEEVERRKRKRKEIRANKNQKATKAGNSKQPSGKKLTSKKSKRPIKWSDSETESNEDKNSKQSEREENEESSNSDSKIIPPSRVSANTKKFFKGDYVIITYEGEYFPGVVESIDQYSFEISTMTFSTGNTFRWPEKPDKIWYTKKELVERIDTPVLSNKRGFYVVKEMTKFLPFTV